MTPSSPAAPDVAVLVVNWNTCALLAECLDAVAADADGLRVQTVVVDNASSDDSVGMVRERFPEVRLIAGRENVGFVGGNNRAYASCDKEARYVLMLNSDAALRPGALRALVGWMDAHPAAGACGPLLLNSDGSLQASWSRFPSVWGEICGSQDRRFLGARRAPRPEADAIRALPAAQPTDWVGGACLLARRAAIDRDLGGVLLDPAFQMYSEETDLCFRLKRCGWAVYFVPQAEVTHHGGQSSRQMPLRTLVLLYRSKVLFFRRHYGSLKTAQLKVGLAGLAALKWLLPVPRGGERRQRQRAVLDALREDAGADRGGH